MTRTRPLPYLFMMSGTRETSRSTGEFPRLSFRLVWPDNEQRLCHRASRSNNDRLARALYCFLVSRKRFREDQSMSTEIHPVDQILPTPRLLTLGLQHVLVMYAGAVAVPLIIGRALKLPPEDVAFLISADLFACGLATLVQCIGFPGVGIRLPVMMGVTFASVGPMLSMAAAPDIGLLGIYGSVIAAGIFGIIAAPFIS